MEADVSICTCWQSHKTEQPGSSSLVAEASPRVWQRPSGLPRALSPVKGYRCELRDRRAMNREIRVTTITMTDAKSLRDCINREQFAWTEKRAALKIATIRGSLENLGGQCRWFPRELNPADGSAQLKRERANPTTTYADDQISQYCAKGGDGQGGNISMGHQEPQSETEYFEERSPVEHDLLPCVSETSHPTYPTCCRLTPSGVRCSALPSSCSGCVIMLSWCAAVYSLRFCHCDLGFPTYGAMPPAGPEPGPLVHLLDDQP
eukprot:5895064-Pyramimonas_sp.AAC.1